MGKKDKKRAETEAGLVSVEPEAVSSSGVGAPSADAGETSMAVDGEVDTSVVKKAKKDKKDKKEKKEKKEKKDKKDKDPSKKEKSGKERKELEIPADALSPIAHPLAGKKLNKSTLKLVKRAARARHVKRGVKEVVKALKKGEKGFVIMAADISPMDILTHIPLLAEEALCPYVFVTSKDLLGQASSTKRPTSCVMICPNSKRKPKKPRTDKDGKPIPVKEPEDYKDAYTEVTKEVEQLDSHISY